MQVQFSYEYERKLKVGYVGTGEQSFSNILPCFQYLPLELVAVADHDSTRGLAVARQFGAKHFYPNHKAMLAKEKMDAVFFVVGPDVQGKPRYPDLAEDALREGFHVWIDSPPCSSMNEIKQITYGCTSRGKWILTCFPRMFAPAYLKVAEIIKDTAFGGISSFTMRYPATLPPMDVRGNTLTMGPFLANFLQPYSVLLRLFGECEGLSYLRSALGDAIITFRYRNGVIGSLYLTGSQALTSPTERLEVVGNGANVIVENGLRLTYYRAGGFAGVCNEERPASFIGPDENAPIIWQPDMSLGPYYNKELFFQGYVGCIQHFAERILQNEPPRYGNISDMLHMMVIYDKIRESSEKTWLSCY